MGRVGVAVAVAVAVDKGYNQWCFSRMPTTKMAGCTNVKVLAWY